MSVNERFEALRAPIDSIAFKTRHLANSKDAYKFAIENPQFVLSVVDGYTSLIRMTSGLSSQEFAVMPHSQKLLSKYGFDEQFATPEGMLAHPRWNVHCAEAQTDLAARMAKAEENIKEPGKHPAEETIYFGTLVTTPQAYIVGIVGHAIERQIIATVPSKKEPWEKDDVLHALNELVMLRKVKGQPSPLFDAFTKSPQEGGLGWIRPEYLTEFNKELTGPRKSITPEETFLSAFEFFETDKIYLDGLIRIALVSGCPNADVAQGVLHALVTRGRLTWHKDESGKVYFALSKIPPQKLN